MARTLAIWVAGALLCAAGAFAQPGSRPGFKSGRGMKAGRPPGARRPHRANPGGRLGIGPTAIDRWNRMSPEEQQKALDRLPPEQRRRVQQRIDAFNSLPPEERQRLRERYQRFANLPPEKQDMVRQDMRQIQQLAPDRRRAVVREFQQLRNLPEADRRVRMTGDEFRGRFSSEEQRILENLAENFNDPQK